MPLVLAGLLASGIGISLSAPVAAASIGQYSRSIVQCNWRNHIMSITAAASPAPGFTSQAVSYRYYLLDVTTNGWVPNYAPTSWGTISAWTVAVNAVGSTVINQGMTESAMTNIAVSAHHFVVYTQYAWYVGGAWLYSPAVQSTSYQEFGYAWERGNGLARGDYCVA